MGTLLAVVVTGTAHAEFDPNHPPVTGRGHFTEAVITGAGTGRAVSAYDAPAALDPPAGYPAQVPEGSTPHTVSWAGTLRVQDPADPTRTALTYCIDLRTDTETGVPYELGDGPRRTSPTWGTSSTS